MFQGKHMKNLSLCLFVLALSTVGCESKPAAKTAPVMPNPATMGAHAGAHAAGQAAPAEKKEGEVAAPAEGEKKEGEAAAPAADPAEGEKEEGEAAAPAAAPAEGEKKE